MSDALLEELLAARRSRTACALVTVAATTGSVPRETGAKMLVYADGNTSGTIGGGKFEALVVNECLTSLRQNEISLKTYPLHEASDESFGAICGGEATVLIEPQNQNTAIYLVGGGHCSLAIAKLALESGMHVTVVEDRAELLLGFPPTVNSVVLPGAEFIAAREWQRSDALLLVSRNHELDHDALAAALRTPGIPYIGMIGSRRKVRTVFERLRAAGVSDAQLGAVYAPLGLDIGADCPTEIAISALGEVMKVLRNRSGEHLRTRGEQD